MSQFDAYVNLFTPDKDCSSISLLEENHAFLMRLHPP